MFLVKVMSRHDCGSHYWKEKFVSGLLKKKKKKVRQKIRNIHNGRILYESLTYGELVTFINNDDLALCTNFKLKSQMKKEKQDSKKKKIGKFCSYYGYDTIVAPSKRKNNENNIKGKKPYTESKFQKKFVKSTPNKSKSSNKTTFKKENTNML